MNNAQITFIKKALDHSEILTDFEYNFLNSITDQDDKDLDDNENAILNKIYLKFLDSN